MIDWLALYLASPESIGALRVVAVVMAALVVIDSIGIFATPQEQPPHHPRWNALAWMVLGFGIISAFVPLIGEHAPLIGQDAQLPMRMAIVALYASIIAALTVRAVARAHRPAFTLVAAIGMIAAALFLV